MLDASVKLSVTFSALVWRGFIVWSVNVTACGESVERRGRWLSGCHHRQTTIRCWHWCGI